MLFKEQNPQSKKKSIWIIVIFLVFLKLCLLFDFQKDSIYEMTMVVFRIAIIVDENNRRRVKKIYDLDLRNNNFSSNKQDIFPFDSKTTFILTS